MKTIILAGFLFISISLNAQTRKVYLSSEKIDGLRCEYYKEINGIDTSYYIIMTFKNAKYSSLSDMHALLFTKSADDQLELSFFKTDLISAIHEIDDKKSEISWSKKNYRIDKFNFSKNIYITATNQLIEGYFIFDKGDVAHLLNWLSRINFGSDILSPEIKVKY